MDIPAAIGGLSSAYTISKTLISTAIDLSIKEQLIELNDKILNGQKSLQEAQTMIYDLQEHRQKLDAKLKNNDSFLNTKSQYNYHQLNINDMKIWVYKHNDIDNLYACPVCLDKEKLAVPIQDDGNKLFCSHCTFLITTREAGIYFQDE